MSKEAGKKEDNLHFRLVLSENLLILEGYDYP